jgi:hypothetical protein
MECGVRDECGFLASVRLALAKQQFSIALGRTTSSLSNVNVGTCDETACPAYVRRTSSLYTFSCCDCGLCDKVHVMSTASSLYCRQTSCQARGEQAHRTPRSRATPSTRRGAFVAACRLVRHQTPRDPRCALAPSAIAFTARLTAGRVSVASPASHPTAVPS